MFIKDTTYDVMVGMLASKAVDRGFEASVGSKQTLSN